LNDLRNNLLMAHKHSQEGNYALCVYLASRTKAEANIMVTMLGVKEEVVGELLKQKLKAAKRAVTKQIEKGTFPIIAYSYYEYATSLSADNNYAALIYAEYALELSDTDIYFEKKAEGIDTGKIRQTLKEYIPTAMFVWGLVLGYLFCWVVMRERRKTRKQTVEAEMLLKSKPKRSAKTGISLR
jgi:predicted S18 family serine protease